MRTLFVAVVALFALLTNANAQNLGGFAKFLPEEINEPGSFGLIEDPTGAAPFPQVFSFAVTPGPCSDRKYSYGDNLSDCAFKSIRSQIYEDTKKQPKFAWYEWSMYLPTEFPVGNEQAATGLYSLAYWHNGECPHLALVSETNGPGFLSLQVNKWEKRGQFYCAPDTRIDILDLRTLRGAWHRFEMFVKWEKGEDGEAQVYIDGKRVAIYKGRTLNEQGPSKNYFKAGVYLCCTLGTDQVTPATAYFTAFKRSETRNGLFTEHDVEQIVQLQKALNELGCNVGQADGAVGKQTRDMAISCRQFPAGQMPDELSPGTLQTFLQLYSQPDVANLPKGALPLDPGAPKPESTFKIHVTEVNAERTGRESEIISTFAGTVRGKDAPKKVEFVLAGQYDFSTEVLSYLQLIIVDDLGKDAAAAKACAGLGVQTWGDGSSHVVVEFDRRSDGTYTARGGACVTDALPKAQATQMAFLLDHFADIAASMVSDGTADFIKHEGLKSVILKLARGEAKIMR